MFPFNDLINGRIERLIDVGYVYARISGLIGLKDYASTRYCDFFRSSKQL